VSLVKCSLAVLFIKKVHIYIYIVVTISIKGRFSVGNSILFSEIKRL
jgi:hypothetical protein